MSSGGSATLINQKCGTLVFDSEGLSGNGVVTAGNVDNAGIMGIPGTRRLLLAGFRQRKEGSLSIPIEARDSGRIECSTATLAGVLKLVEALGVTSFARQYLLMSCNARQGMFSSLQIVGKRLAAHNPRLIYRGSDVLLKLD
jgi:hypothetical protein